MRPLRWPEPLTPGARVAVVAPSGPVDGERLRAGLGLLEGWGLDVTVGRRVHAVDPVGGYLAGADAERAADFVEAWCSPGTAVVWSARGGYGAQRMLDHLDWAAMEQAGPRLYVGSSDATALHTAIRSRLGLVTLFGPMPATSSFVRSEPTAALLHRALFGQRSLTAPGRVVVPGQGEGSLIGGNLTLLATSVGCDHADQPGRPGPPAIALLEDVKEAPYAIDRALTQLLRSGWFEPVRGVVLGSFVDCGDPAVLGPVLQERLAPLGVPVIAIADIGHGPDQRPVWLGAPARLQAGPGHQGQLVLGENAANE